MRGMRQGLAELKRLSTIGGSNLGFTSVPSMPGSSVQSSLWEDTISSGVRTGFYTIDHQQKLTRYFINKKDLFKKKKGLQCSTCRQDELRA